MFVVAAILVAVIVFVIAAWAIGREAQRLGSQRLMPVYRLDEAVDFVSGRLSFELAASMSRDEVREVLREHTNVLQFEGGGAADIEAEPVLLQGESVVAGVYRRVRSGGFDVTRPQVDAVVAEHLAYLAAIGALGRVEGQ